MSAFNDEINSAMSEMIDTFADVVFVNGIALDGVINDDQYDDETGIRREISISFNRSDAPFLLAGASVIVGTDETEYTIRRIDKPSLEDPFYTVDLKRA